MNGLLIPVSIGELYDKISILEIKQDKIKDADQLLNIKKELDLLTIISKKIPINPMWIQRLKYVNITIWKTEDQIRRCEKEELYKDKDYKEYFISLARAVYINNDERSLIKKLINKKYGSEVIEEKSYEKY